MLDRPTALRRLALAALGPLLSAALLVAGVPPAGAS